MNSRGVMRPRVVAAVALLVVIGGLLALGFWFSNSLNIPKGEPTATATGILSCDPFAGIEAEDFVGAVQPEQKGRPCPTAAADSAAAGPDDPWLGLEFSGYEPLPPDATAICQDNTLSFAQELSARCLEHGGILLRLR